MKQQKQLSRQRRNAILMMGAIVLLFAAVFFLVKDPIMGLIDEPERLREIVQARPILGRVIYLLIAIVQVVVAVIPGEPVEILGGYAFGAWEGAALFLLAGVAGSMPVFLLVRRFGVRLVRVFFSEEQVEKLHFLRAKKGRTFLFFLIFAIPGTPKDLLSYFAGLTDISIGAWFFICSVGRLPSVLSSAFGGSALGEGSGQEAMIIFAVTIAVSAVGALVYRAILKQNEKRNIKNADCTREIGQADEEETQ